jgi:hypothetical protein
MLVWSWRRTAIGVALSLAVAALAVVAYRHHWSIANDAACVAGVILLVSAAGRLTAMRDARWADVREPVPAIAQVRDGRAVVRRVDVFSRSMLGLIGLPWLIVLWARWYDGMAPAYMADIAVLAPLTVMFAIPALAPKVIVTPQHLRVDRCFTRSRIPRTAIEAFVLEPDGAIAIKVRDHPAISYATGALGLVTRPDWNPRPAQLKEAGRLKAVLDALPVAPAPSDGVVHQRRPVLITLAVGAAVDFTVLVVLVSTGVIT